MAPANDLADVNGSSDSVAVEKRPLTREEIRARIQMLVPGVDPFAAPETISCEVRDSSGASTSTVSALSVGDDAYWFCYGSGGASSTKVTFIAIPLFSGCPQKAIIQVFELSPASTTDITTPFGVPFWGSDLTSGRWILIVKNSGGDSAYCLFEVVP